MISANAPRTYSKITRNTSSKVSMKGNKSHEMDSERISSFSVADVVSLSRTAESCRTGRMNSSEITVKRKIHPNVAIILATRFVQLMDLMRGYSNS